MTTMRPIRSQPIYLGCDTKDVLAYEVLCPISNSTDCIQTTNYKQFNQTHTLSLLQALEDIHLKKVFESAGTPSLAPVSINIPAYQLLDRAVLKALESCQISLRQNRCRLIVELLEDDWPQKLGLLVEASERLIHYGIELWLDDVNDNDRYLECLRTLPVSAIKVSLLTIEASSPLRITQTISNYQQAAQHYNAMLIIEGIESTQELMAVRNLPSKPDGLQGYLLAKPKLVSNA